jgi:uncharacterized membrane protein
MKKIPLAVTVISFLTGFYLYPYLPDKIASHWGITGEVNGYMGKFWGIFLMPVISVVLLVLFIVIPKIDPLSKNIARFRKYFDRFIGFIFLFLFYIYLLTIFWNLGFRFNMSRMLAPAFSLLFYQIGILIGKAQRNWSIGVRTPWTLSSDDVWNKTHRLGSKGYKILAIIGLLGLVWPVFFLTAMISGIIVFSLYLVFYSYFEYQRQG